MQLFCEGGEDDLFCIFERAWKVYSSGDFVASAAVGLCDLADVDVCLGAE